MRRGTYLPYFGIAAAIVFLTHFALLNTPFYWDELGQFVPASLDLFQLGRWVPVSTVPNIHPPGLMAYLSCVWQVTGYSVPATRMAMLILASVGAFATFPLGTTLGPSAGRAQAFTALLFLCLSPLFVAQATMAQLDMPAMVFTSLALLLFLQGHLRRAALACVLLVMVKETGIVAPALFGFLLLREGRWKDALLFTAPLFPLGVWLAALHRATGHWAGNESFAAYNAFYSLHPVRFGFALTRRFYYLFVGSGHWVGAAAMFYAWRHTQVFISRGWRVAGAFAATHILLVSLFGGAVLERYLLPVLPLLYLAFAAALFALPIKWRVGGSLALLAMLATANFVNPVYPFPFENNLAYITFCGLHQKAAAFVQSKDPGATVTTTFPMAGALRRPEFGYVSKPLHVREIGSFEEPAIRALMPNPPQVMILYSVAWDPLHLLANPTLIRFLHRFYGYEPQATSSEIQQQLHMRSTAKWTSRGQWVEVFQTERDLGAR